MSNRSAVSISRSAWVTGLKSDLLSMCKVRMEIAPRNLARRIGQAVRQRYYSLINRLQNRYSPWMLALWTIFMPGFASSCNSGALSAGGGAGRMPIS